MNFFKNLFRKKQTNIKQDNGSESINFDLLVKTARDSGNSKDLTILYSSLFNIKDICFVISKNSNLNEPKPFIGIVDNAPSLFAFTDIKKAKEFVDLDPENFYTANDGNAFILKTDIESFVNMTNQLALNGVYGVRFNEGENGWFISIQNLMEIYQMCKMNN